VKKDTKMAVRQYRLVTWASVLVVHVELCPRVWRLRHCFDAARRKRIQVSGTPWADFDGAGLVLLAPDRQGHARQVVVSGSAPFVVTDHAADEKVQQESFFSIGVTVEQGQFIFRVGDYLFLVVAGIFLFLQQPTYAELFQEYCDVTDLVAIGAFRIGVSANGQQLQW
jgi:hypothetical protein